MSEIENEKGILIFKHSNYLNLDLLLSTTDHPKKLPIPNAKITEITMIDSLIYE